MPGKPGPPPVPTKDPAVATNHSEPARKPSAVLGNVAEVPPNVATLRTKLPTLRTNDPAAPRIARVAHPIVPRNPSKVAAELRNLLT